MVKRERYNLNALKCFLINQQLSSVLWLCVCVPSVQVHEPHEAPPGAGETEQWELGQPHNLPSLLQKIYDSVPAAVPHRERPQPHRIVKYEQNCSLWSKIPLVIQHQTCDHYSLFQPLVRSANLPLHRSKFFWNIWRNPTNLGRCRMCARCDFLWLMVYFLSVYHWFIDSLKKESRHSKNLYFSNSIGLQLPILLLLRCGDSLQDCPRKLKRVAVSLLLEGSEKWSHVYAALHETPGVLL